MVIQFGAFSPGAPGSPDINTTVGTPISEATLIVSRTTLLWADPVTGWSWFPFAFSALKVSPRELIDLARTSRAVALLTSSWKALHP